MTTFLINSCNLVDTLPTPGGHGCGEMDGLYVHLYSNQYAHRSVNNLCNISFTDEYADSVHEI